MLLKDKKKYHSAQRLPSSKIQTYLKSHKIEKESEEIVKNFIVKCVLNDSKLSKNRIPDDVEEPSQQQLRAETYKTP